MLPFTPVVPPVVIARKRLIRRFEAADAVCAERAISFAPGNFFQRKAFEQFRDAHVLRSAAGDRWYLDVHALDSETRCWRDRALALASVAVAATALIALMR